MKVAYCGNFDAPHSTENHVTKALENLGHGVLRLPEQRMDWALLPSLTQVADLFLWTRTAGFDPPDLELQRKALDALDIPTVGFHLDRWVGLNREADVLRSPFFGVDYLFTADGGHEDFWRSHGINHIWSPPGILSDEAKRVGVFRPEYAADVGFVGNLRRYGHPEWGPYRYALYKFLVKTYGSRFKLWEGGIRGQDLADLYQSVKVLVGDSCLAGGITHYWSDRIPETLGRGGYLIHPWVEGLAADYPMLPTYLLMDFGALREKIDRALADDDLRRDTIAANRFLVREHHTYEHRLERLLSIVL